MHAAEARMRAAGVHLVGPATLRRLHGLLVAGDRGTLPLGAVLEPRILRHVAAQGVPFLMEVVVGTAADRRGGHVARRDGRVVLRETAQAPDGEASSLDARFPHGPPSLRRRVPDGALLGA